MLKILRGGQRWLIWFVIVGIGGVFVFFLGLQGPLQGSSSGGTLVSVGPYQFGSREFERVRAQRVNTLQQQLGDDFDPTALRGTLDQLAAGELVNRALLAMEAEALGLAVSKSEVEKNVLADPGFRDSSGRFNIEEFENYAEYEYGSQNAFVAERRLSLLALKMIRLLQSQPRVSDGEARDAVRRQLEAVRIAFVTLGDGIAEPESIDDELVATTLLERGPEIRVLYDEHSEEFNQSEAVHARHILFSVGSDEEASSEQAALESARGVLERLRAGEDFTELASSLSDDVGSRANGGDLGFLERGQMVPPFEEAAFSLAPGELSEPVQTSFGVHLIKVEEHREALHLPFEEVQDQLTRELLAGGLAERQGAEQAEQLAAAIRDGSSLEQAAREMELTLERSGLLTRRGDGFIPGLGAMPEMLAIAFSMEVGESSPHIFEQGTTRALLQVLEREEADPAVLEERLPNAREQLLLAKRNARAEAWVNARRNALVAGGELLVDLPSDSR
jgi:peptidyl-prolyl cis-trans isomerase D